MSAFAVLTNTDYTNRFTNDFANRMKPKTDNFSTRCSEPVKIAVIGQAGVGKSALVVRYLTKRFIWEYDPTLECVYKHQTFLDGRPVTMEILDTSAVHDLEDNDSSDIDGQLSWADGVLLVYSVTDRSSFELAVNIARRLTCASGNSTNQRLPHHHSTSTLGGSCDKLCCACDEPHPTWSSFSSSSSTESVDTLIDNTTPRRVETRHNRRRHCVVLVGNKSDLLTERCVNLDSSSGCVDIGDGLSTSSDAKFFYETSARDGGPEIAAAFDGLCRHVLAARSRRQPTSGNSSPTTETVSSGELMMYQEAQQVAPQIDKRRLAVLKTVNRLVKKLHVSRSSSFSSKQLAPVAATVSAISPEAGAPPKTAAANSNRWNS